MSTLSAEDVLLRAGLDVSDIESGAQQGQSALERMMESAVGLGARGGAGIAALLGPIALVGAAVVDLGKQAFDAWEGFDAGQDKIGAMTGKSGADLDELSDTMLHLKASSAGLGSDFEKIGSVIGDLSRRTGASGQVLEDLSSKVLKLAKVTGGDAAQSTASLTRLMGDWSVGIDGASMMMDKLLVASQNTGINVNQLSQSLVRYGAPLRNMGFSMDQSIAMMSKWEKEGVNMGLVLGGMRIATGKFAKEHIPLQKGIQDTITKIKGMTNASDALALGMKTFGVRAGPDMVAAIREGRFEFQGLVDTLQTADGAVDKTLDNTLDFTDRWAIMWAGVQEQLIPLGASLNDLAGKLLPILGGALNVLLPVVSGFVSNFVGGLGRVIDIGGKFAAVLSDAFSGKSARLDLLQQLPGWLQPVAKIFGDLAGNVGEFAAALQAGQAPLEAFADFIKNNVIDLLANMGVPPEVISNIQSALEQIGTVAHDALAAIPLFWQDVQTALATGDWQPVLDKLGELKDNIVAWITETALPAIATQLGQWKDAFVNWISDGLPDWLATAGAFKDGVITWITDTALPELTTQLGQWKDAFINWISDSLPDWTKNAGDLSEGIITWIRDTALPAITTQLGQWKDAFIQWISDSLPGWRIQAAMFGDAVINWLGKTVVDIAKGILDWASSMVDNMFPVKDDTNKAGEDFLGDVVAWMKSALPALVKQSNEWAQAFLNWITLDVLPELVPRLEQLSGKMIYWGNNIALPAIKKVLDGWVDAFLNWVKDSVIPFIGGKLGELLAAIEKWINDHVNQLQNDARALGAGMINGIWSGITGAWANLTSGLGSLISGLPDFVKKLLGISSPSVVFAEDVGVPMVEGIAKGAADTWPMLEEVMSAGLIDTVTRAAMAAQVGAARAMGLVINTAGEAVLNGWAGIITELNSPKNNIGKIMLDLLTVSKQSAALGITDVATTALEWFDKLSSGAAVDFAQMSKDFKDAMAGMLASADPALRALAIQWFTTWDQAAADQQAALDKMNDASARSVAAANAKLEEFHRDWIKLNQDSANSVVKANLLLEKETTKFVEEYNKRIKVVRDFASTYADVLDNPAGMGAYQDKEAAKAQAKKAGKSASDPAQASLQQQLDLLAKLADPKTLLPSKKRIDEFYAAVAYTLDVFAAGAAKLKDQASDTVTKIAANIGTIMGGISAALEPLLKMKDVQKITREQIEGSFANIWFALHELNEVMKSGELQGDWQQRALAFSDTMNTLFAAMASVAAIGETAAGKLDFAGIGSGLQKLFDELALLTKNELDPLATVGIGFEWVTGWNAITTWFRDVWSTKFANLILNPTLTELRLVVAGQAAGFSEAGKALGNAVIDGMVAAIRAGAAQVAAAVLSVTPGGAVDKPTQSLLPPGSPWSNLQPPAPDLFAAKSAGSMGPGPGVSNYFAAGAVVINARDGRDVINQLRAAGVPLT